MEIAPENQLALKSGASGRLGNEQVNLHDDPCKSQTVFEREVVSAKTATYGQRWTRRNSNCGRE